MSIKLWNWISWELLYKLQPKLAQSIFIIRISYVSKKNKFPSQICDAVIDKAVCVHFGNFPMLAMLEFQTTYIMQKPFASILFFDIIVEILTSSFE